MVISSMRKLVAKAGWQGIWWRVCTTTNSIRRAVLFTASLSIIKEDNIQIVRIVTHRR